MDSGDSHSVALPPTVHGAAAFEATASADAHDAGQGQDTFGAFVTAVHASLDSDGDSHLITVHTDTVQHLIETALPAGESHAAAPDLSHLVGFVDVAHLVDASLDTLSHSPNLFDTHTVDLGDFPSSDTHSP